MSAYQQSSLIPKRFHHAKKVLRTQLLNHQIQETVPGRIAETVAEGVTFVDAVDDRTGNGTVEGDRRLKRMLAVGSGALIA
jgi:hypothetical protein